MRKRSYGNNTTGRGMTSNNRGLVLWFVEIWQKLEMLFRTTPDKRKDTICHYIAMFVSKENYCRNKWCRAEHRMNPRYWCRDKSVILLVREELCDYLLSYFAPKYLEIIRWGFYRNCESCDIGKRCKTCCLAVTSVNTCQGVYSTHIYILFLKSKHRCVVLSHVFSKISAKDLES